MNSKAVKTTRVPEEVHPPEDSYWLSSRRPLNILVFLAPFLLFYEIGLVFLLREDRGTITNLAHEWIISFMGVFNVDFFGLSLPGFIVVVVLLLWHVFSLEPWRVDFRSIPLMLLESLLLMVPLIVLSHMVRQFMPLAGSEGELIETLGPMGRIAVSIGAGLYEELVFRMLVVLVIHTLMVDVLKFSDLIGAGVAILVSAGLFTWYHPVWGPDGTASMGKMLFYFAAGLWFGVLYVARGFGIVVAVHAFYDIAVLLDWD
ncbi:MAG: CPBP family intramembrane metalloprotease [Phycisphaerales bacterium]|nr:CPBP family intramembrane metalloprotease [Phycisphaerales bacterium]